MIDHLISYSDKQCSGGVCCYYNVVTLIDMNDIPAGSSFESAQSDLSYLLLKRANATSVLIPLKLMPA